MSLGYASLKFMTCKSCQISDSQSSPLFALLTTFLKKTQQGVFLLGQKHREQVRLASKNGTMALSLGLCLFLS
jgi:hypothetical protein